MSDRVLLALAFGGVLAFMCGVTALGNKAITADEEKCKAHGGVQVKVYGGFECVKAEVIDLKEHK